MTAYELLISDWSSDVWSSDLDERSAARRRRRQSAGVARLDDPLRLDRRDEGARARDDRQALLRAARHADGVGARRHADRNGAGRGGNIALSLGGGGDELGAARAAVAWRELADGGQGR